MPELLRKDRVPVRISGPDAQKLLNNVLTAEIAAASEKTHWWALLSPQGKIQAEGLIGWHYDGFWLDVHEAVADAFLKRMKMYRLRADVEIADMRETHVVGWAQGTPVTGFADRDPRSEDMGYRIITETATAADWPDPEHDATYAIIRIGNGITELGADFAPDSAFPHDIGMDLLSGVDFAKGCYVGQEVVSRMQHRGTARRRPVIVTGVEAQAGAEVVCGGKSAGSIGQVAGGTAVALLRLDRLKDPETATIEGRPVQLALPFWASYRFGDSGSEPDTDRV